MELEIDVKNNLLKYLPSIFLLLQGEKINWNKISTKYQEELYSRKLKLAEVGMDTILVKPCLFDVITRVIKLDSSFFNLLKFIDEVFLNLANKTTTEEKRQLRKTVFNVLVNTDKNYLNFIGELAVLNNLKNAEFELLQTEQPLSDGNKDSTKVDFTVRRNNKILLVEVVNIHLPSTDTLSDENIKRLLTQKITSKLNAKQKSSDKVFFLVPVLWGEYEAIKLVNDYYTKPHVGFKNTLHPMAFMSYSSKDDKLSQIKFGTIDKLILQDNAPQ